MVFGSHLEVSFPYNTDYGKIVLNHVKNNIDYQISFF